MLRKLSRSIRISLNENKTQVNKSILKQYVWILLLNLILSLYMNNKTISTTPVKWKYCINLSIHTTSKPNSIILINPKTFIILVMSLGNSLCKEKLFVYDRKNKGVIKNPLCKIYVYVYYCIGIKLYNFNSVGKNTKKSQFFQVIQNPALLVQSQ
mgnify:CR=1 FL=1